MKFLGIISFIVISFVSYNLLKIFVFSNLKINKWIVMMLFLLSFAGSLFVNLPSYVMYIIQWVYIVLLLWFIDLYMDDRREKKIKNRNKRVIKHRPKPNPNRVKGR